MFQGGVGVADPARYLDRLTKAGQPFGLSGDGSLELRRKTARAAAEEHGLRVTCSHRHDADEEAR